MQTLEGNTFIVYGSGKIQNLSLCTHNRPFPYIYQVLKVYKPNLDSTSHDKTNQLHKKCWDHSLFPQKLHITIEPKGSLEVIPKVGTYPIMLIAHQNLNSIFGEKVVVILTSTICEEFFQPHPHSKNSKPSTLLPESMFKGCNLQ